jgi:hypothetical protein
MSAYGTVTDYKTGEPVRPATAAEWRRTADVVTSGISAGYAGAWEDADGRPVYVDGGPEPVVTRSDVHTLRDEAGAAGDAEQARLCDQALGIGGDAWAECVRVILGNRMAIAADADL